MRLRNRIHSVILTGCLLLAGGCDSPPKTGDLSLAIRDYNAQRYSQAQERAASIVNSAPPGPQREQAAYLAGLSAYQLGQPDEAERRLTIAANSSDAELAAKSKVMLGQVRLDQHRPRDAATCFVEAAPQLGGEDARQNARHAALAHQLAGDADSARRWQDVAHAAPSKHAAIISPNAAGAKPQAATAAATVAAGFTLQVGAFQERDRAQLAADQAEPVVKREGLGTVRIMPRRDERGRPTYLVQFGWFPTRAAASEARNKIGRLEYIVAALHDEM